MGWIKSEDGKKRRDEFDFDRETKLCLSSAYGKTVRDPVIREDIFNVQLQEMAREDLADWCLRAVDIISSGIASKLSKDNVTVYKVKNLIRVDIKE